MARARPAAPAPRRFRALLAPPGRVARPSLRARRPPPPSQPGPHRPRPGDVGRRQSPSLHPRRASRARSPPAAPVVIHPLGFGNDANDYVAPSSDADASLKASLERRGVARARRRPGAQGRAARLLRGVFSRGFYLRRRHASGGVHAGSPRARGRRRPRCGCEALAPAAPRRWISSRTARAVQLARAFARARALNEVEYDKPFRLLGPARGPHLTHALGLKHAAPRSPSVRASSPSARRTGSRVGPERCGGATRAAGAR